jgi:hypothetical protein
VIKSKHKGFSGIRIIYQITKKEKLTMKKIISLLITAAMLLALGATLASCAHECTFSDEWSKDANAHWHVCENEKCEEIADKADHTWNEGEITAAATQEKEGTKTFTCTVCGQTKTEAVVFTGLTKDEWNAAFADSVFENFVYSEEASTTGGGVSVNSKTTYKLTKDDAWYKMTVADQSQEGFASNKAEADVVRKQLADSIKEMTSYDSFEYDAATKTYKASKPINIAAIGTSTSDVTLKFDGDKLVEIKYSISFTQSGISFNATSTVTLSDYGTVTLSK